HVPHPLVDVEAPGAQFGERSGVEPPLLTGPAHCGRHPERRRRLLTLEGPLVDPVLVAHHLGNLVRPLGGHMVLVHVGWLDHVIVDAHQDHVVQLHKYSFQPTKTGRRSQPRTVDVCACLALSQSISQSGHRVSTSSRATRPSSLARAAPRQKWMPYPKLTWWSIVRWMSKRS